MYASFATCSTCGELVGSAAIAAIALQTSVPASTAATRLWLAIILRLPFVRAVSGGRGSGTRRAVDLLCEGRRVWFMVLFPLARLSVKIYLAELVLSIGSG